MHRASRFVTESKVRKSIVDYWRARDDCVSGHSLIAAVLILFASALMVKILLDLP